MDDKPNKYYLSKLQLQLHILDQAHWIWLISNLDEMDMVRDDTICTVKSQERTVESTYNFGRINQPIIK
jgi:hypothetical protein